MSDKEMKRMFSDLGSKVVLLTTEEGTYKRDTDGSWYLLDQGDQERDESRE